MKLQYSGDQRATEGGTKGRMTVLLLWRSAGLEQGVGGRHPQLRMAVTVLALRSPTSASAGASSTSLPTVAASTPLSEYDVGQLRHHQ